MNSDCSRKLRHSPRPLGINLVGAFAILLACLCNRSTGGENSQASSKSLIPWKALDEKTRTKLEDVVDNATVWHRTPAEVFACNPELYLLLLNEPILTLELWKNFGVADASLQQQGPGQFQGADGHLSSGRWEFVYRSPELNVIYAEGQYRGPLLGTTLETKSVLVLRTVFFQERDGKQYVKHQLDGFVKAESGSLKPIAKALRPIFQKSVEATMQESLWFVSLMCRYTHFDPHSIARALDQTENVREPVKTQMQKILNPLLASTPLRKEPANTDQNDQRSAGGDR